MRPAVLSETLRQKLDEYRGFRHVIRNIYSTHIDPEKLSGLVTGAPQVFDDAREELLAFTKFLDIRGKTE